MGKRDMTVPAPVRQKLALLGAAGSKWLADLDDLIDDLEQEWQITIGAVREGGTEAYVAQARTRDGTPAILKVAIPESEGNDGASWQADAHHRRGMGASTHLIPMRTR